MKPILYPAGETQFQNNGLGRLSDMVKCLVTEERNGQYELEMQYPITGIHYKDITEERIIAARHDDSDDIQPFRIYKITRPMNGIITVNARHISYQLSKVAVMPFSAGNCPEALAGLVENSVGDCPFTMWTDRLLEANFSVDQPSSFRSLLGGVSGSILDVYGPGEYEWDKFTVKFHSHRGTDQDVHIRYGKNMTDVKKTSDTSNLWTGVLPFWAGTDEAEQAILVTLPEKVVYSDYADHYTYKMVIPLDLSSEFTARPTEEQLRVRAQSYVRGNSADGIPASIDVSFVALWQTEEYKNWAPLQKLKLCDTVTVYHKGLGIENKAKIVSVTYNVLLERYEKMTIGEVKTNLGDSIRQISEEIKKDVPTNASVSQAISLATNILSGSLGGNIVINTNEKGQPVEILSMDTADISTARKILKISKSGISFSATGYTGTFTLLVDMNGKIQGLGGAAYTDSSAYAASGHKHAASDLTSGTIAQARLPVVSKGKAGIAPAPTAAQAGSYLRGDGTWADPAATTAPGKIASDSAQGASISFAREDHTHGIDLAEGDGNGQVKIAGVNVPVKGLGSAAFTDAEDYASASHTHPQNDTIPSAYCTTAAETAAKEASCSGYTPLEKSYLQIIVKASNTATSALTLNINGAGEKPIYINGEVSSEENSVLPAGSYFIYYDGTNYHFRTDGRIPGIGNLTYEEAGADIETIYLPTTMVDGVPGGYTAYTVLNGIIYEKEVSPEEGGEEA